MRAKPDHMGTALFSDTIQRPVRMTDFVILKGVRQKEASVFPFEFNAIAWETDSCIAIGSGRV